MNETEKNYLSFTFFQMFCILVLKHSVEFVLLRMSVTQRLQLTHPLSNQFDLIYQTLLDFRQFGKIHAYIQEVKIIQDQSPEFIEYRVFEEIYLLGCIKNNPVYDVKVYEVEKNKHIRYVSQVKKNISLIIDLHVTKESPSVIVVQEKFEVKANFFLGKVFLMILNKAHLQFFENLRKILHNSIEDVSLEALK